MPYLTLQAFRGTLAFLSAQPAGTSLVFDYGLPRDALSGFEQLAIDSMAARVRAAGEPFQLFFRPEEAAAELARHHLTVVEDLGGPELNHRYFRDRTDNLRLLGSAGRILHALRA